MSSDSEEIYISVDIETAGPIPAVYSLLSIGSSVVGMPEQYFYAELKPINENSVPEALAVGGFSLHALNSSGEDPLSAFQRFHKWIVDVCANRKPVFVGFNAAFDWSFVNWYFHVYLGQNPFGFAPLDVKAYYMGMSGCRWGQTTSSKLPARFQPSESAATHNALDDARAQAEIFAKLVAASSRTEDKD